VPGSDTAAKLRTLIELDAESDKADDRTLA
jgi:hypothetical protein